jgi:cupin 2 domain-containing protein
MDQTAFPGEDSARVANAGDGIAGLANIHADLDGAAGEERFRTLLARPGLKVERIVSTGQCSPPGFWYDAPQGEWVLVLQGHASLRFEDEAAPRTLRPGDFLDIAPHRRHRVDWTDPAQPTVWLAVHYG